MANRAYLLAVQDRATTRSNEPAQEIIAEGVNEIPVFWASLFIQEDRVMDTYKKREGGDLQIANWCVSMDIAKQRLAGLEEPIGRLLDAKSKGIWSKFVQHLSTVESVYFKTNAAEIWALDPAGYEKYWSRLLRLFAEPTLEHLADAVRANELTFENDRIHWADAEMTACKLAGADHIRDVPWLSDLPGADPPTAADIERKRKYDEVLKQSQWQLARAERNRKVVKVLLGVGLAMVVAYVVWYFSRQ